MTIISTPEIQGR